MDISFAREWHHEVSEETRKLHAQNVLNALLPEGGTFNPESRNADIFKAYARYVEKTAYYKARTRFEYYRLLGDRILLLKGYMKVKYSKRRIRNRHRFSQIFLELDQLQLKDGAYALPDPDYPDEEDLEDINDDLEELEVSEEENEDEERRYKVRKRRISSSKMEEDA